MEKSALFIMNPVSGRSGGKGRILQELQKNGCNILFTEYAGHATELAKNACEELIVAVGGDGTVNEVAQGLIGTGKTLGIIPCGSGDGLARTLGISHNPVTALDTIENGEIREIDWGTINGKPFFSVCGVGFDAIVSRDFASAGKRGLKTYISVAAKDWRKFHPEDYRITIDGREIDTRAAMVTVANSRQWGNGAQVAPKAETDDGMLDVTVIHMFHDIEIPNLALMLMTGHLDRSHRVECLQGRHITIERQHGGAAHCDGDYIPEQELIDIRIEESRLKVICPSSISTARGLHSRKRRQGASH